jgi:hypothetical protein
MDVGSWQRTITCHCKNSVFYEIFHRASHLGGFLMRWVGQVAHIGDMRNEYRILVGISKEIDHLEICAQLGR